MADAWSLGSLIFALIGAIFTLVGLVLTIGIVTAFVGLPFLALGLLFLGGGGYVLYRRYRETLKSVDILRNGAAVIGQITEARTNYSVTVNGRNPLTVDYAFRVENVEYQGSLTTLNPLNVEYCPGQAACVLYLPAAPQYSSLYPHP